MLWPYRAARLCPIRLIAIVFTLVAKENSARAQLYNHAPVQGLYNIKGA